MLSRALILATVVLLVGCFAEAPAHAQNLEAGKSPSQIFAGTCTACHRSPRGLLRTVPPGSLPGFLREHYTTSSGMASLLSTYLISNGAADTRYGGGQPRPDKRAKSEARSGGEPGGNRLSSQAEPQRRGDNARRQGRDGRDAAKPVEAQAPVQQANQHGRDGRKARHRPGRRSRPVIDEEPGMGAATPDAGKSEAAKSNDAKSNDANDAKSQAGKTDAAKTDADKDQSAKTEPARDEHPASAEGSKPAAAKPSGEGGADAAKVELPDQTGTSAAAIQRADPVPPVAPAPAPPTASTAAPGGTPSGAAAASVPPSAAPAAAVAASSTPEAPRAPAAADGPPTPPVSK